MYFILKIISSNSFYNFFLHCLSLQITANDNTVPTPAGTVHLNIHLPSVIFLLEVGGGGGSEAEVDDCIAKGGKNKERREKIRKSEEGVD